MLVTVTRILPVKFKRLDWNSKTWKSTGVGYYEWEANQIIRHYMEIYPNALMITDQSYSIWDDNRYVIRITLNDPADEAAFILGES